MSSHFIATKKKSRNLLTGDLGESGYIKATDGSVVSNSRDWCSPYIPVTPSTDYYLSADEFESTSWSGGYAFYDSSEAFIPGSRLWIQTYNKKITTPATAAYIRIWIESPSGITLTDTAFADKHAQLELGTTATPYVPYGIETIRCVVRAVTKSTNLFDKSTVSNGYTTKDGTVDVVTWYRVSDYIDVSGLEYITYFNTCSSTGTLRKFCFYDKDKNFISAPGNENNLSPVTLSVPQDAVYFRMPVAPTCLDICQLNAGNVLLQYEPYGYILSKALISTKEVTANV